MAHHKHTISDYLRSQSNSVDETRQAIIAAMAERVEKGYDLSIDKNYELSIGSEEFEINPIWKTLQRTRKVNFRGVCEIIAGGKGSSTKTTIGGYTIYTSPER